MDYKDELIKELKEINDKLISVNEKQINVNMEFANVTQKNNEGYQKTFRWLISICITAITAAVILVCLGAMIIFSSRVNSINTNKNINVNTTEEGG